MTTLERESITMPEVPEGFKGAKEIPEWVWKLMEQSPNAETAWNDLVGLCEESEPDEAELYRALQEFRKEKN